MHTESTGAADKGTVIGSCMPADLGGKAGRAQDPVSLMVTAYQQAVVAGGSAYTDSLGDPWAADRAYSKGSWGYVQKSKTDSTSRGHRRADGRSPDAELPRPGLGSGSSPRWSGRPGW
jgi:hypothetical protein